LNKEKMVPMHWPKCVIAASRGLHRYNVRRGDGLSIPADARKRTGLNSDGDSDREEIEASTMK